jgi:hypothetical protein
MTDEQILERLAGLEHQQFIAFTKSVADEVSKERLERWKKLWRPYRELPEIEKETSRFYARKVVKVLQEISSL